VLHRLGNSEGYTLSATSAQAPNEARKLYEKGLAVALKKPKNQQEMDKATDEALKSFSKAVEIYPKYAAAWFELGKVYETQRNPEEAKKAYEKSVAADAKFVPPYQRMSLLAMRDGKWEEVADMADRVLRLDPFTFPDAFFTSSVAHLQLNHLDLAEKNVREAIKVDARKQNPRAHYVLGIVLARKEEFAEAAQEMKTFLAADPQARDVDQVRGQLQQIEQAAAGAAQAAATKPPAGAQQ
jgi:tetratricopeptide (TPR) repeat protein